MNKINQRVKNLTSTSNGPSITSQREHNHILNSIETLKKILVLMMFPLRQEDIRSAIDQMPKSP